MKKAQRTDFIREIRKTLGRFLSILFIVALGTAFYAGIRSSEPDMELSADRYFDESALMDIRVISTLGLTDDDLEAVRQIDGVECAEGSKSAEAFALCGEERAVMQIMSLTDHVNQMTVKEGRLPEKADECFMDSKFMHSFGYKVGDKVKLADPDGEAPEDLEYDEYTITGSGSWSWYLSFRRGTASIGSGSSFAYMVLCPEAFTADYYSTIYLTVEGAADLNTYSDEYEARVDEVQDRIKDIAEERSEIRFEDLQIDAREQLDDAKKKVADAENQLDSALGKLNNGESQYRSSLDEYNSGRSQYQSGLDKYNDAKSQLDSSKKLLDDTKAQLDEGANAIAAGRSELAAQKEEMAEAGRQLDAAESQVTAALLQVNGALQLLGDDPGAEAQRRELLAQKSALEDQQAALTAQRAQYNAGLKALKEAEDLLAEKEAELAKGRSEYEAGEAQYEDGAAQLDSSKKILDETRDKLSSGAAQLNAARRTLDSGWQEYYSAKKDADRQLTDAKQDIADGEKKLAEMKEGEWYVLDRDSIQSLVEYGMDSERIGSIGRVFPAIFFLVAALIALTSITRMIEEERMMIGTMKALGYSGPAIASKYIYYALAATISGSILGVLVGSKLLPYVILTAYFMLYQNVPYIDLSYHPMLCIVSAALAILSTLIATIAASYKELLSTPAALMRPPAPKKGSRILLERIPFIWNNLNFSMKSTFRNLFRYKKRFFMTIFGIGGCMAILLVSYGLHDSIQTIVDNQYRTIWTYSADCSVNDIADDDSAAMLEQIMKDNEAVRGGLFTRTETVDAKNPAETDSDAAKEIYVCVLPADDSRNEYINIHNRQTGDACELTDDGAVLSEKIAKMLGISVGDEIAIEIDDNVYADVRVTGISENYLYHYAYVTPAGYEKIFGHAAERNHLYLKFDEGLSSDEQSEISSYLMDLEDVTGVRLTEEQQASVDDMMNALNLVVWVLVISAGLLVFVVTFNLNNINISERRRELASLKVLGFYDSEVAIYVYRENIILTILGILLGIFMGIWLHQYVITTLEVDIMMFGRELTGRSILSACVLTAVFSVIVNLVMYRTVRKINMVESMKSVE